MVIPQRGKVLLADHILLQELSAVVWQGSGYQILYVLRKIKPLQPQNNQAQRFEEDVETTIFRFNSQGRVMGEIFEELGRFVDLLVTQMGKVLRPKEVEHRPDDPTAFPPSPLLYEVMATSRKGAAVLVEVWALPRIICIELEDALQNLLWQCPTLYRSDMSHPDGEDSGVIKLAQRK